MRIAFDARPLNHPYTGIGVYTRQLVTRLARIHELFGYLDRPLAVDAIDGITYRAAAVPALLRPFVAHVAFPSWARLDEVDLFWSPRHHLPLFLNDRPTVVTVHDMVWRVAPETMRPANRWLETILMPMALKRATEVIAVSQDTADRVTDFRPRSPHVVHEAPNTISGAAPYPAERPYFLFVGTREPRKNLARVIAAFRAAQVNADLILVGGAGWGEDPTTDRPDEMPKKRIIDLGSVDDATVASLYAGCLAVVLPSIYEGFGLPLVEGLSYGKPLITSNSGSMPEVAGDAAVYVDPLDIASIQAGLESVFLDQDLAARLSLAARARTHEFSWDRAADETDALMRRAAGRPGANVQGEALRQRS